MLAKLVFRGRTFRAKEASRAKVPGRSVSDGKGWQEASWSRRSREGSGKEVMG